MVVGSCVSVRDPSVDRRESCTHVDCKARVRCSDEWIDVELDEFGNVITTEGTWRAGVDGALPGIIMEAHPRVGDRYAQEVAPGVAEDKAQVLRVSDHLLVTKEWSPLRPGVIEHKYYESGVGLIFGKMVKGGDEFTQLVRITRDDRDHD